MPGAGRSIGLPAPGLFYGLGTVQVTVALVA